MKKRLLFVMESMKSGGGERSLLSLLQLVDYEKYDVDLMLFDRSGLFLELVPKQVNIIPFGDLYEKFSKPMMKSVFSFLLGGKPVLAMKRALYSRTVNSSVSSSLVRDQLAWRYMKSFFCDNGKEYDVAIGYLEGKPNFYVADCARAKTKIAYVHNDYRKLKMDAEIDSELFGKVDYIVTVSEECEKVLHEIFPQYSEKVRMIENVTIPKILLKMAEENVADFDKKSDEKFLLTIGRFFQQKGYDMAIDAAEILVKKGYNFKWFSIGKGELKDELLQKVKEKNLEKNFIFLGEKANPYPYLANCDIYVQPSYFEGKSIAIDEAKCLAKPIVATKFTTVYDQLADGETAVLAEINAESIAEKIALLIDDENLAETLSENLKKMTHGNEEEIQKFYALLGEK